MLLDAKQYDEALKQLDAVPDGPFAALAADRRGDVLLAQGKKAEARAAYERAHKLMDDKVEYRRLVDAKLTALGGSRRRAGGRGLRGVTMTLRATRSLAASVTVAAALLLAACAGREAQADAAGTDRVQAECARRPGTCGSTA